jgi:hypothetical protein
MPETLLSITVSINARFNGVYTLLYVWCDFKAQKFELLTDPFSFIFERGQMPDKANNTKYYE